jgi:hypothetical protein
MEVYRDERHAMSTFEGRSVLVTDIPLPRNASEKIHRLAISRSYVAE